MPAVRFTVPKTAVTDEDLKKTLLATLLRLERQNDTALRTIS